MPELANTIWADGPSGTPFEPPKPQIRNWGTWLENLTTALSMSTTATYVRGTKAQLDATSSSNGQVGVVVADDNLALRGIYVREGSAWVKKRDLPVDASQAAAAVAVDAKVIAEIARDIAVSAKAAAEAARDIAEGYASDAVSQGNVPIYATVAGMGGVSVPVGINAIRVNGKTTAGDGLGGLYVNANTGSADTFVSGDGRTWYRDRSTGFDFDFTVTVGATGNYPTINAALEAVSNIYGPRYRKGGVSVQIRLLNGFVMAEQVIIKDIDLGWITITSEAAEVVIQRSALVDPVDFIYCPAFSAQGHGAVLPNIEVLFNMDTSGTASSSSTAPRQASASIEA